MKKGIALFTVLAALSGCGTENIVYSGQTAIRFYTIAESESFSQYDETFDNECTVELGETISIRGNGAWFENGNLSVTEGGVYNISGSLSGGMVYVESDEPVRLVLKGFSADNPSGSAVLCKKGRLSIEAADNSENVISAANSEAAVYTDGKLEFCGAGKLTVKNTDGGGIYSGEELIISDCALSVYSGTTAICSKNKIAVNDGIVFINADNFGIRTDSGCVINGTAVVCAPNFGSSFSVNSGFLLSFADKSAAVPTSDYIFAPISHLSEQTVISAADEAGNVLISAALPKTAQEVVFSAASCSKVRLYAGGTLSAKPNALGIITDGGISDGTELSSENGSERNAA